MSNHHPIGDPAELATLYVVGAMNGDEFIEFEEHLAEGCARCQAELAALEKPHAALAALAPREEPPPRVREALLARIAADGQQELDLAAIEAAMKRQMALQQAVAAAESAAAANGPATSEDGASRGAVRREPGWFIARGSEEDWVSVGAGGVFMRMLFVDPRRRAVTCLMRIQPGASIPGHAHEGSEECLVLDGELRVGDVTLRAGDFQRTAPGFPQPDQSSPSGCLLLVTSPFE
ncbi:MAG: cupin domain-containing protein [Pirellulales bacterium]